MTDMFCTKRTQLHNSGKAIRARSQSPGQGRARTHPRCRCGPLCAVGAALGGKLTGNRPIDTEAVEGLRYTLGQRIDQHPRQYGNAGSQLNLKEGSVTFVTNAFAKTPALSRRAALSGAGALALPHIARAADALSVKFDFLPWGLHAGVH